MDMPEYKEPIKLRKIGTIVLLFVVTGLVFGQSRIDKIINTGWKFSRENPAGGKGLNDDGVRWENVSLPHTWNARDGQDGGNDYYRGVGWYRKTLKVDAKYKGKSIFLRFDGVSTAANVYVNDSLAGMHKGAFGAFCFEVSRFMKFGSTNTIAVKVCNAKDTTIAPLRGDFTVFGGMYRNVHLLVLDNLSVSPLDYASSGVYVRQKNVSARSADLELTAVIRNAYRGEKNATIRSSIVDREGNVLTRAESSRMLLPGSQVSEVQSLSVKTPHLWNGRADAYTYQVIVEVLGGNEVKDRVVQPVGLRYFSVDPEKGFFLNGTSYRLYGVNRHQDRENKGWAIDPKDHQEDYRMIEEIGCTAVRLAHYQHDQEFYNLCDRGGMIVWAELALVDEINSHPAFAANCKDQLQELIKQNFNHPSIMFWSIYNELMPESNRELYGSVVKDLNALAKQLDPTRPTAMASRSRYEPGEYINTVTDLLAYNVYRGWYEGTPEDFAGFVDSIHQRYPDRPFCISEYGAGAGTSQHEFPAKKPSTRGPWHPEEWQSTLHEVTWKAISQRPFLWGSFVWNMFDFASDSRSEGERLGINDKGLVTYDRKIRKDAFFWYKANWNPEPMVYISGRRFVNRKDTNTEIKIYSNCDSVSLYRDGDPIGTKVSINRIYVWEDIRLSRGRNTIEAVGFKNGKKCKDSCVWITAPNEARRETTQ